MLVEPHDKLICFFRITSNPIFSIFGIGERGGSVIEFRTSELMIGRG